MKGINNTSQISLTPYKSPVFLTEIHDRTEADTVNLEIFAIILFSRIGLKDIFATLKIRD